MSELEALISRRMTDLDDAQDDQDMLCLLYTSDAADERSSVDLGGRRIIKKKKQVNIGGVRDTTTKLLP